MTEAPTSRPWLLLVGLGVITLLSGVILFPPELTWPSTATAATELAQLRSRWLHCYQQRGFPFESPYALAAADPPLRRALGADPSDPWGNGYCFVIARQGNELIPVAVFSFGPDGHEDTDDDLVMLVAESARR